MEKIIERIKLSEGNRKLRNSDKVRFLIWNLLAIVTCPFATEHCMKSCYALKAERCYPSARRRREINMAISLQSDFVERMIATIEYHLGRKCFQGKKVVFRIHESGDFYSQEYADKWVEIINHFSDRKNLVFMAYTKSLPYFEKHDVKSMKNFSFIASVWDDTAPEMLETIERNGYRIYTAVESFEGWNGNKCRCADCAKCQQCMNNRVAKIACEIH